MNWISVKDRTPDIQDVLVLIYFPREKHIEIGRWLDTRMIFVDLHGGTAFPTHWMPLPDPPVEQQRCKGIPNKPCDKPAEEDDSLCTEHRLYYENG